MKKFYITTTLPYVNADPHIGFAMEIVQADAIARYHRLVGEDVTFNTGTDEHGIKIYRAAQEQKKDPQTYVDEYAAKFESLKEALNLTYTNFIRTTNSHHKKAAQEFWMRCLKNGDIYKQIYKTKYCIGCELEKTDSELEDGQCPIHPSLKLEYIEEENYFFQFSKFQKSLLDLYKNNPKFVVPNIRFNEIKEFVSSGLIDFSISRLKEKMPWGVPVPNDADHVMFVWFDALVNYISTLGWPEKKETFNSFWPGLQVAGKDNLRQQSAMWQAMLMSAGLPTSKQIFIHGFITSDGQKMSKTLGNVVDPFDLVEKYGVEAVRFYLLREIPAWGDGDFSLTRFRELYNGELANGLGNLVARVARLASDTSLSLPPKKNFIFKKVVSDNVGNFRFDHALIGLWEEVSSLDKKINEEKPWELEGAALKKSITPIAREIREIAFNLGPFLPQTSQKILDQFTGKILAEKPLFPRI